MLRQLVEMVRSGRVSAVDTLERAYERIGRLNGDINAVVALRNVGEAHAEAKALDDRVRRGERLGPLTGVPFLVKDSQDLAGMRTTHGSLLLAESPPAARDALGVARLRAAGAIPIGKTNVPEHCFEGFTDNLLFGATHNPWAPEWSPGGSSGGSAAALAAGMVPIATASDGGGSVRVPAAFCGLFGLKPTNGLVGRDPIPPWIDFSTDGPLALSMADLRLKAYGFAAAIFALDRLSKWIVETKLSALDTVQVIPGLFNIVHSENRGMAFGIMNDSPNEWRTTLLVVLCAAAVLYVSVMLWSAHRLDRKSYWGLTLILGGAAGNVFDRAVFGRVTDFLDFYIGEHHWHTFNVADSAIVIGSLLLMLDLLRPKRQAANVS